MPPKFVRNPAGSDFSHARRDEKVIECIDWSSYDISLYLDDNLMFTCKTYVVKQMVKSVWLFKMLIHRHLNFYLAYWATDG